MDSPSLGSGAWNGHSWRIPILSLKQLSLEHFPWENGLMVLPCCCSQGILLPGAGAQSRRESGIGNLGYLNGNARCFFSFPLALALQSKAAIP